MRVIVLVNENEMEGNKFYVIRSANQISFHHFSLTQQWELDRRIFLDTPNQGSHFVGFIPLRCDCGNLSLQYTFYSLVSPKQGTFIRVGENEQKNKLQLGQSVHNRQGNERNDRSGHFDKCTRKGEGKGEEILLVREGRTTVPGTVHTRDDRTARHRAAHRRRRAAVEESAAASAPQSHVRLGCRHRSRRKWTHRHRAE